MQPTKTKKEWENIFKGLYISIIRKSINIDELYDKNEEQLNLFKAEYTLDSNSIEFLPAYFNFIECNLAHNSQGKLSEINNYLMVSLTNLHYASKKKDEKQSYNYDEESTVYDEEEVNKKLLQSRLDLLFGRSKLASKCDSTTQTQALDALTSSIITYSEIYGPESVGLTPQYFYLAEYFLNTTIKNKELIAKNIYLKIADIWKLYFTKVTNPLFLENNDKILILALGEAYLKLIITRIGQVFPRDSETELMIKFRILRVIVYRKIKNVTHSNEMQTVQDMKRGFENKIVDKEFMEELEEKWTKEMKNKI